LLNQQDIIRTNYGYDYVEKQNLHIPASTASAASRSAPPKHKQRDI